MKHVIHIYGASGSGTSTLGKAISDNFGYFHMDTDDYYWLPTNPRFTEKRKKEERLRLMKQDMERNDKCVISGSLVDWGDSLIPFFDLAIRVVTDTGIRIERIKKREYERFGERILPGGDLYKHHMDFVNWASRYDDGDTNIRSKAKHDEWERLLTCDRILVDGTRDRKEIIRVIEENITIN